MDADLVKKLRSERKFYLLRSENLLEQIEKKKLEVLDMEYRLEALNKDMARSEVLLDLLRDNGF